jgi:hypothetical protein
MELTSEQSEIVAAPLEGKIFLSGPAGSGKTAAAVARLHALIEQGIPTDSILLMTPQRFLNEPYLDSLEQLPYAGGEVTAATISGLARRMVDLFWPVVAQAAGFAHPDQPPVFLTLETAQYYLARVVGPLLEQGFFESVTIDRNRLYQQILDNLNKAAMIGFPHTEIGARLDSAYYGEPAQRRVYADAQECANLFRQYCLDNNLLDFSLQLEIFTNILWPLEAVHTHLSSTYRHLVFDNLEEEGPRAHDILREWLGDFESALLLYDEGGGYRTFLGADPQTGWALRELCDRHITFAESLVMSPEIADLSMRLAAAVAPGMASSVESAGPGVQALSVIQAHFYPELLDGVAREVKMLVENQSLPASEIVILAPYMPDVLRFSIMNRLEAQQIAWRSHRPSRSLRDEPASHALLTLASLAHPDWELRPPKFDVAYALMQSIDGLDLVRAQLLAEIVYRPGDLGLSGFENIKPDVQERITFSVGERYTTLRDWIMAYRDSEPLALDHFLRRLFGEVLSQQGFRFHRHLDSVRVASSLIESIKSFRQATEYTQPDLIGMGREYVSMLQDGVIAAQYLEAWRQPTNDALLVAPAHTFLMMNRPATVQFWLDIGSSGWYERLSQPLTHPYVLSRQWTPGRLWTDADEVLASQQALARLVSGLLHRCRERVYIGLSELGEAGFEQRGELLSAFQRIL